jgi:enamine deaminase RidA (YjgF/YER057c/UK114 family)
MTGFDVVSDRTQEQQYVPRGRHAAGSAALDSGIATRSFRGATGEAEHFIIVEAPVALGFQEQLADVQKRYEMAQRALGLAPETAIFRRLFLSDVLNQSVLVRASGLAGRAADGPVAVSIVQQPPLGGAKLALMAYHVESRGPMTKRQLSPHQMLVEKRGLRHLWSTGLCAGADDGFDSAAAQTTAIFDDLVATLNGHGGTLRDDCVRTWLYVKDVDVFYQGMVESRTALFERHGLTRDTHYIASTGIEGACGHRYDLVAMDAYSVLGLVPEQISYLNDFDHLCATKDYNVTFERGTRIAYADRSHLLISGTASIDRAGAVVHPGDVLRQLERALDNVEALLRSGSASLADLMHLTTYLRDPSDFAPVAAYLAERFPDLPVLIVQGAVCRPQWLVEVEGVAIAANHQPNLPSF